MLTIFGSPENLKDKVEALTISNELLREDNTALQDRVSELEEVCNSFAVVVCGGDCGAGMMIMTLCNCVCDDCSVNDLL